MFFVEISKILNRIVCLSDTKIQRLTRFLNRDLRDKFLVKAKILTDLRLTN